jgi:hypothetical protein
VENDRLDGVRQANHREADLVDKAIREAEFILERIDEKWPEEEDVSER